MHGMNNTGTGTSISNNRLDETNSRHRHKEDHNMKLYSINTGNKGAEPD
jgi:hypothetical protein